MTTHLYALIEQRPGNPNFGRPLYIGIGTERRPFAHIRRAKRGIVSANVLLYAVLTDHFAEGVEPAVQFLGAYGARGDACAAEIAHIAKHGRIGRDPGGILCNVALGGDGPDPSLMNDPEILARIGAASRARWDDPNFRAIRDVAIRKAYADPALRTRVSDATAKALAEPDTRAKHVAALERINAAMSSEQRRAAAAKRTSKAVKRATSALRASRHDPEMQHRRAENSREPARTSWADPEIRARRVAAMKGKRKTVSPEAFAARQANAAKAQSPEAKAKRAAAVRARWGDPAYKAKMAAKKAAAWADPEKRERMLAGRSEGIAKSWQDPAVRARRIDGIKAASECADGEGPVHESVSA